MLRSQCSINYGEWMNQSVRSPGDYQQRPQRLHWPHRSQPECAHISQQRKHAEKISVVWGTFCKQDDSRKWHLCRPSLCQVQSTNRAKCKLQEAILDHQKENGFCCRGRLPWHGGEPEKLQKAAAAENLEIHGIKGAYTHPFRVFLAALSSTVFTAHFFPLPVLSRTAMRTSHGSVKLGGGSPHLTHSPQYPPH